jgi:hypothetical protein
MSVLNQLYLSELSKQYKIESVEMFEFGFSSYCISPNKRERVYLLLCDNLSSSFDVYFVLDKLSLIESASKAGNSYLCIMPADNPIIDLCTHCNGKSFVHFIFLDKHTRCLVYDKKIYYWGCKQVKRLIDIFQNCFNELKENNQ